MDWDGKKLLKTSNQPSFEDEGRTPTELVSNEFHGPSVPALKIFDSKYQAGAPLQDTTSNGCGRPKEGSSPDMTHTA